MNKFLKYIALSAAVLIVLSISLTSCGKKDPAKAKITVEDENGTRIEGATVYLLCTAVEKNECVINDTATTNSAGQTEHEFDHPAIYGSDDINFTVLRVEAFKLYDSTYTWIRVDSLGTMDTTVVDSTYTKYGETYIELQIDKEKSETVTILKDF